MTLRRQEVSLGTDATAVLSSLRETFAAGDDVIVADDRRIIRRFAGSAGRFRYATVELLEFDDGGISFEHLRGPFAVCHERFDLLPAQHGSSLVHSGTFSWRGGLWGWLFGHMIVKPAFDNHVREHLLDMRAQFAPPTAG